MAARLVTQRLPRICLVNYNAWAVIADAATGAAGAIGGAIGGEEIQHVLLSRYLARQGWHVTSIVGDFGQQPLEDIGGVEVRKTFALDAGLPGLRFFSPRLTSTWAALAAADADAYYVSCAGAVAGVIAAFCQRHRRRFVFRIASDADCTPASLMLGNARDRWLYRYALRRADCVLAQTERQAALLRQHYGVGARLAGMFADVPGSVRGPDARSTDLLWLANLRAMKRPGLFLELARALPSRRCVMAGGLHHAEASLFEQTARSAGLLPNLRFLGRQPVSAARALFADARVFVNTSSFEGFPNTYLQAWSHGTPVVATFDPDGLIGVLGLGAAVHDVAGAVRAAEALLGDRQAWAACSARCRAYACAELAPDRVARPYLAALVPAASAAGDSAGALETARSGHGAEP